MAASANKNDVSYRSMSILEHIKERGMWAGAVEKITIDDLCGIKKQPTPVTAEEPDSVPRETYVVYKISNPHTPALLKSWDELIVNASDHFKRNEKNKVTAANPYTQVTYIKITFNKSSGVFTIENDGPGIPIEVDKEKSKELGHDVYIPEMVFCVPFSGTNFRRDDDNVNGGVNGLGSKIANAHSNVFIYRTITFDKRKKQVYTQKCFKGVTQIDPPTIVEAGEGDTPRTSVVMSPNYVSLGYGDKIASQIDKDELMDWLHLRCCQLGAYVGDKVKVTLNGEPVHVTSAEGLAQLYVESLLIKHSRNVLSNGIYSTSKSELSKPTYAELRRRVDMFSGLVTSKELPYKKHPWKVVAIVLPQLTKFVQKSIINGVVTSKGTHVTYIRDALKEVALKTIKKVSKDKDATADGREVSKHMLLVVVGAVPKADWSGQRKDELSVSKTKLSSYKFNKDWLSSVGAAITEAILESSGSKNKKRGRIEKHTRAQQYGNNRGKGSKCSLILSEGDSANALIVDGLTLGPKVNPGGPTFVTYGVFTLGGVPINAAKNVTKHSGYGGEERLIRSKTLKANTNINNLEEIIGLDINKTYATQAERNTLKYREIIAAVDQDHDGAGKILGLLLTYVNTFWPELLKCGFVKWFMTPIIRVYPPAAKDMKGRQKHGPLIEFYQERNFHEWVDANQELAQKAHIRYFKGLGGHESHEVPLMFKDFEKRLYTIQSFEDSQRMFDIYFGVDSAPRKAELRTPLKIPSKDEIEAIENTRIIPCSHQLQQYAKAYKLDALCRQIPGLLDSMTSGRRKLIAAARDRFTTSTKDCKTFQLAAYAADKKSYHHGGASMEGTVIKVCQTYVGARGLALLIGSGQFGSRSCGGHSAASPRYTSVSLNSPLVNALLPREDDPLLRYEFVDGVRAEPSTFVPTLPLTVLDTMEIPSEGWNYRSFGRKPSQIYDIVESLCAPVGRSLRDDLAKCAARLDFRSPFAGDLPEGPADVHRLFKTEFPLDPSIRDLKGKLQMRKNKEGKVSLHHVGEYRIENDGNYDYIVVTELPIRKWTNPFVENLLAERSPQSKSTAPIVSDYIEDVLNTSNATTIDISIKLKPGALDEIKSRFDNAGKHAQTDAIIEFLGLYTSMRSNLNVMVPPTDDETTFGGVMECGSDYHIIILLWFKHRKALYKTRIERKLALRRIAARMESEILRYISLVHGDKIHVAKIEDDDEAASVLCRFGFPLVNKGKLEDPKYASVDEIKATILQEADTPVDAREKSVSYNYILNLRERDLTKTAYSKRRNKHEDILKDIAALEECLNENPFAAASVWMNEVNAVRKSMQDDGFWF